MQHTGRKKAVKKQQQAHWTQKEDETEGDTAASHGVMDDATNGAGGTGGYGERVEERGHA